jgi:hypothetical protein
MIKTILATAVSALLFSGSALAQEQVGGHTIYRTADPAIWTGDATSGPLVHKETNTSFPEQIGPFKRTRVMAIDNGRDVAVHYEQARAGGALEITVFLFQPGDAADHALKGSVEALTQGGLMQIVWSDGPFDVDAPTRLRLFKGTYKTGIGPGAVMDYLYFGNLGKWTVKVRATLPSPKELSEEQAMDAFVGALPWSSILTANGACSGVACNGARPMAFDHHIGEMFLTQLTNSGQGKKVKDAPGPLFARSAGGMDWKVEPLDPVFVKLFTDGFGSISTAAPLYSLAWSKGKKSGVVRFFTGTPTEDMFDRSVDALMAHPEESAFVDAKMATYYLLE